MSKIDEETGNNLLCLLHHPSEPIFLPKSNLYFDIPSEFVDELYRDHLQSIYAGIQNRYNNVGRVEIRYDIASSLLPSDFIAQLQELKKNQRFSQFLPRHRELATLLIKKFMNLDAKNLLTVAAVVRDLTNSELFNYCLSVALLHREDTRHLRIFNHAECFPEKFVPSEDISNLRRALDVYRNNLDKLLPVEADLQNTGTNVDPEYSLAYFREDIGVNLHHWQWHLVYPFAGDEKIVKKDRRGELFYYMHHQLMARYNIERFCNKLDVAQRLLDLNETIVDGYFPMLDDKNSSIKWSSRAPNIKLRDVNRPGDNLLIDKDDLRRYKERIFEAIHKKKVVNLDGNEIDIDNDKGIDVLGNIVESVRILSPEPNYYGDMHNLGHLLLAYAQDPKDNYNQPLGVLGSNTTAMRDPLFYRWHALVDDIFLEHKNSLPSYTDQHLKFDNIKVTSVDVITKGNENILETFMSKNDFDVSKGLDFVRQGQSEGKIYIRFTHLNHNDFEYNIKVDNASGKNVDAMVRIFMGPARGFRNTNLRLQEQKNLMIEMDKFVATLSPGTNLIKRKSTKSSVTIPHEQTFNSLIRSTVTEPTNPSQPTSVNNNSSPSVKINDPNNLFQKDCARCGWPQHMLVPRGTAEGYPMVIFVMFSDYEKDKVINGVNLNRSSSSQCKESISFCGLRDRTYPDKRPMGFPFDRRIDGNILTIEEFSNRYDNMLIRPVNIFYRSENVIDVKLSKANQKSLTRLDFDIPDVNSKMQQVATTTSGQ